MVLELNRNLIDNCNNNSQFNSGNILAREAVQVLSRFDESFSKEQLTDEQLELLEERKEKYKKLVEEAYNDMLSNRSRFVPWNVSGRANYPAEKMRKIGDRNLEKSIEWHDKIDRFINNTHKMIKDLKPIEEVLEDYKEGRWKHGDKILSDDPYIIEKLNAKLEYLEQRHTDMKNLNRKARSEGRQAPFPAYALTNNLASIKTIKKRIEKIDEAKDLEGFIFEAGEVIANCEMSRLQIFFNEKPCNDIRDNLKRNGFRWAPSQGVWQRQLNKNSLNIAKRLFHTITEEE